MREVDDIEPEAVFPVNGFKAPMTFEPNKDYVRDVLARTIEWTGCDSRRRTFSCRPIPLRSVDHCRGIARREYDRYAACDRCIGHLVHLLSVQTDIQHSDVDPPCSTTASAFAGDGTGPTICMPSSTPVVRPLAMK